MVKPVKWGSRGASLERKFEESFEEQVTFGQAEMQQSKGNFLTKQQSLTISPRVTSLGSVHVNSGRQSHWHQDMCCVPNFNRHLVNNCSQKTQLVEDRGKQ